MAILRNENLSWKEVDALDRNKTVYILSLSPIEEHGPHLPCGTDFFAATDFTELAAQMLEQQHPDFNWVIYPPIPLGCTDMAADFPGTVSLRGKTLLRMLTDILSSIARHGFKYIAISNHHLDLGHFKAILLAIKKVEKKYPVKIIEPAGMTIHSDTEKKDFYNGLSPVDMKNEIHAGFQETSFILYKYPQLVKPLFKTLLPVFVNIEQAFRKGKNTLKKMEANDGYIGSPAQATESFGKIHYETGGKLMADSIIAMLENKPFPTLSKEMKFVLKFFIRLK
jgi:creatinine amidohydrolase